MNWGYFGGSANKTPGPANSQQRGNSTARRSNASDSNYQIYVGELDLNVNKQALVDHFKKKYDSIVDAKIITDPNTRISKGFGFVIFSSYDESQRAISEMQGSLIKGKPIKVSHGFSRNSGSAHGNSHSRSGSSNPSGSGLLGQVYGNQMYGGGAGSQNRGGSILGGLGAQFKPAEPMQQQFLVPAQQFAYINGQPQALPSQLGHGGYALAGNPALYSHQFASQQQLLFNYQAALSKAGLSGGELQGQLMQVDPALQAFGLAGNPQGLQGLYPASNQLGGLNPQLAGQFGYQLYFPAPAGMVGPGQPGPQAWGLGHSKEELPQVAAGYQTKQLKPMHHAEDVPLEIQSNNKLAILNFMQNYDPKTN